MTTDIKHHVAIYGGKEVVIDYVPDPKREFHIACMRVQDNMRNGQIGWVKCPDGKVYEITVGKRLARLVSKVP